MAKRANHANLVAAIVAGMAALFIVSVGVGFAVWLLARPTAPRAATMPVGKVWEREELRKALLDQKPDDVLRLINKPDSTSEDADSAMWTYRHISRDPVLNSTDALTFVHFDHGRVSSVRFTH